MFVNYAYEIWTVSATNAVDVGTAYDIFRADVRAGGARPYNTGTALPNVDFAAARKEWDALTEDEQKAAYEEWHEFLEDRYAEACAAFAEGEEAMIVLVEEWRADVAARAEEEEAPDEDN